MKYIATRDGVQIESPKKSYDDIFDDVFHIDPSDQHLSLEVSKRHLPTKVSDRQSHVASSNQHAYSKSFEENLVEYISKRPGVAKDIKEKFASPPDAHGLFCVTNNGKVNVDVDIKSVMKEVGEHKGRLWTNILSLKREDARDQNFESKDRWAHLLRSQVSLISCQMNIPIKHLKIYGAFHDEGHHPHCHFMVWSSQPKNEQLRKENIAALKSAFTNEIFFEPLLEIKKKKSFTRDEIRARLKAEVEKLADDLELHGVDGLGNFDIDANNDFGDNEGGGNYIADTNNKHLQYNSSISPNPSNEIKTKLLHLAERLPTKGKKVYAYLPRNLKSEVNDIVDALAQHPEIALLYEKWQECQGELTLTYRQSTRKHGNDGDSCDIHNMSDKNIRDSSADNLDKLSSNPEFRPVLNAVVKVAYDIKREMKALADYESLSPDEKAHTDRMREMDIYQRNLELDEMERQARFGNYPSKNADADTIPSHPNQHHNHNYSQNQTHSQYRNQHHIQHPSHPDPPDINEIICELARCFRGTKNPDIERNRDDMIDSKRWKEIQQLKARLGMGGTAAKPKMRM